jgi:DNA invertase Pin-like site-specific DNA recombinase
LTDFTPSVNLFNDFYAKDTSRKIRAVKKAQAERGERIGTRPPYGYKKSEDDPNFPDTRGAKQVYSICARTRRRPAGYAYAWGCQGTIE